MQPLDSACVNAVARLLARPDPPDLPRRAHVLRYEGDPDRRATRLPGIMMAWLQRRHLELEAEVPLASATRTWRPGGRPASQALLVLRPTGTG